MVEITLQALKSFIKVTYFEFEAFNTSYSIIIGYEKVCTKTRLCVKRFRGFKALWKYIPHREFKHVLEELSHKKRNKSSIKRKQ